MSYIRQWATSTLSCANQLSLSTLLHTGSRVKASSTQHQSKSPSFSCLPALFKWISLALGHKSNELLFPHIAPSLQPQIVLVMKYRLNIHIAPFIAFPLAIASQDPLQWHQQQLFYFFLPLSTVKVEFSEVWIDFCNRGLTITHFSVLWYSKTSNIKANTWSKKSWKMVYSESSRFVNPGETTAVFGLHQCLVGSMLSMIWYLSTRPTIYCLLSHVTDSSLKTQDICNQIFVHPMLTYFILFAVFDHLCKCLSIASHSKHIKYTWCAPRAKILGVTDSICLSK